MNEKSNESHKDEFNLALIKAVSDKNAGRELGKALPIELVNYALKQPLWDYTKTE
jgi:hypothetical protein